MRSISNEYLALLDQAIQKGLVVFCPKNENDLRRQYSELATIDEFKDVNKVSGADMYFVWLYSCASSPFAEMDDAERFELSVQFAYKSDVVRSERMERWKGGKKLPPGIHAAVEKMRKINTTIRIRRYQAARITIDNCMEVICSPMPGTNDPKGRQDYLSQLSDAHGLLSKINREMEETGSYGVEESRNTILQSIKGSLREHRSTFRTP